jgi:hypothetical protein
MTRKQDGFPVISVGLFFACFESLSRSSGDKIPFLPVKNRRINYRNFIRPR